MYLESGEISRMPINVNIHDIVDHPALIATEMSVELRNES